MYIYIWWYGFPYANHGAGICTATKLGDFVANVGVHIPAPWFAYGFQDVYKQFFATGALDVFKKFFYQDGIHGTLR